MINRVERETGFEPATLGMGGRCSTPELLPHGANYTLDLGLSSSLRAVTHSVMFRRAAQASVCPSARVISVFAVRFKHRPHPNPPRGRGGNRDSSPVHGGGWELVRVHRFDTESLRQGRFSPRGRERVGAPCCPHPLCPPLPRGGRGGLWSAEAKLPPTLKLTLQHSKQVSARLPSPTSWERGWG